MNPELRCKMLNNRFAGEALKILDRFYEEGLTMNGQIVLCKGYNDKEELNQTIEKLSNYLPYLQSVSVVPVGLTKYREGLTKLEKFTNEDAKEVIKQIETWQKRLLKLYGTRMVHASDEWYLTANLPIPNAEQYEGYLQLENGVGMVRLLLDEFMETLNRLSGDEKIRQCSLATGVLIAPILQKLVHCLCEKYPNTKIKIYAVENDFFGQILYITSL